MALFIAQVVVYVLGYMIIVFSLIPLIRNDNWMFRIFEYPRFQKLMINGLLLAIFIPLADRESTHAWIFGGLMLANAGYLVYQVFPYTIFSKHQMKAEAKPVPEKQFRLLICNVYQDNKDVRRCLDLIAHCDPDIIILVEVNDWWYQRLKGLEEKYRFRILKPLENTYGMVVFSKLELIDPVTRFLIEDDVPSMRTKVRLPSGDIFQLYCLHPEPPVPQENPRSTERDAEILTVAKESKDCSLPVVVAGDLNDVAWSYSTELFMKISGLLDPRRGRGFFNTFNAHHWFLRWPLDHVFCSKHFQLVQLQRLPAMGSDHFPILVELVLDKLDSADNEKEALKADADDCELAEEKIENAK